MLRQALRDALFRLLDRQGYAARLKTDPPRGFERFLTFARQQGLAPRTVVDVGVGHGTPWLYPAFPQAHFVLVEPLDVFRPTLDRLAAEIGAECHLVGAGEHAETRTILVSERVPTSSSLLAVHSDRLAHPTDVEREKTPRTISIRPLDSLLHHAAPYLLKLDIEGAELAALRGAVQTLRQTQMVIVEASVMRRYDGEGSFAELVAFLDAQGFRLFDVIELNQLGAHGPLSYIDAAFVPHTFPAPLQG